jgi:hypothetical protein
MTTITDATAYIAQAFTPVLGFVVNVGGTALFWVDVLSCLILSLLIEKVKWGWMLGIAVGLYFYWRGISVVPTTSGAI